MSAKKAAEAADKDKSGDTETPGAGK